MSTRQAIRKGLGVKLTHGQTTMEAHDLDGQANEAEQLRKQIPEDNGDND